jgi:hypothetical protein
MSICQSSSCLSTNTEKNVTLLYEDSKTPPSPKSIPSCVKSLMKIVADKWSTYEKLASTGVVEGVPNTDHGHEERRQKKNMDRPLDGRKVNKQQDWVAAKGQLVRHANLLEGIDNAMEVIWGTKKPIL